MARDITARKSRLSKRTSIRRSSQGAGSTKPKTFKIFLSHSGGDAKRATRLAAALKDELYFISGGYGTEIFNTSEPEYRFKELEERLSAGEAWQFDSTNYEEELRAYLTQQLLDSSAYVLLVTPESLAAASGWVKFEIETARSHAIGENRRCFFPCVQPGASHLDLPEGANEFQAVKLDKGGRNRGRGIQELAVAVLDAFRERGRRSWD